MLEAVQLLEKIKKGDVAKVYVLSGDEAFYIDLISDYFEKFFLKEEEKAFNQTVLYAKEAIPSQVVETARQFPMGAEKQLIILKEARHIAKMDEFEAYFKQPTSSSVLVICLKDKSFDKRTKAYKAAKANNDIVLLETKKLRDYELPNWISAYVKSQRFKITPKASMLISEHIGNDLSRIAGEINKLKINLPAGSEINDEIVERYIGISKDYNVFELTKALNTGDHAKAQKIAYYFGQNQKQHPLVMTLGMLYSNFSKILGYHYLQDRSSTNMVKKLKVNPFAVKEIESSAKRFTAAKTVGIISLLREADLKSKGVGSSAIDEGELLKEVCFRILH